MARPEVSFHTAGKRLPYNSSHIIINQAYVQYIPPVNTYETHPSSSKGELPILFVHGGALIGAMWESTPDRRPGWAVLASRPPHSRPVYCVDAVDSGRSQRCPDTYRTAPIEYRTSADMWWAFRFGPPADFDSDTVGQDAPSRTGDESSWKPFQDLQFPLDHSDRLLGSQSARRRGDERYEAEAQGLRDAIAEIGLCDLVAHSNGCAVSILALLDDIARSKVRRLGLIEPGPPHTQSLQHIEGVRTLLMWGDHLSGHKLWDGILAHYGKMGGDITVYDLPKMGFQGNSHFPMHDRNSNEIGKLMLDWLETS